MKLTKSLAEWRRTTERKPVPRGRPPSEKEACYAHIGKIMREMRERRSWTQQELGDKLLWTRASVANIESGQQRVMMHDVPNIANVLGIRVRDLLLPAWLT